MEPDVAGGMRPEELDRLGNEQRLARPARPFLARVAGQRVERTGDDVGIVVVEQADEHGEGAFIGDVVEQVDAADTDVRIGRVEAALYRRERGGTSVDQVSGGGAPAVLDAQVFDERVVVIEARVQHDHGDEAREGDARRRRELRDHRSMRLALASILCEKDDLAGNLGRHLDVLDLARRERCDLAVFPEMSITGSIDPASPDDAVAIDHPTVRALIDAAAGMHVAVLFGLAERSSDGVHITQAYAHHGALRCIQRKRHLGEGEDGFSIGTEAMRCRLGAVAFGAVICAEASQSWAWDRAADGATLVCFTSAPGLHGRRTTDEEWRDGFTWWDGHGLGQAREHAARLGVWVAMATQAGSTADEDFPGISALVSPQGEVVDRLPAWNPGVLVVDVPMAVDVEPIRHSVRVLVVDADGQTLLAQFGDDTTGRTWWVPPGGGIDPGEDDLATARRELQEELGRTDLEIGPAIGRRGGTAQVGDRWLTQYERWYLCRTEHFEVAPDVVTAGRAEGIRDLRWWSAEQLRAGNVETGPRDLADLLDGVLRDELPAHDVDLGF
jgi:predicted amidohydrolase/8-oxo-dGTP pyrophosphatase MutT (NUDIX family)